MSKTRWFLSSIMLMLAVAAGALAGAWLVLESQPNAVEMSVSRAVEYSFLMYDKDGRSREPAETRALIEQLALADAAFVNAAAGYDHLDPHYRTSLQRAAAQYAAVDAAVVEEGAGAGESRIRAMARAARTCIRSASDVAACASERHAAIRDASCIARAADGSCVGWNGLLASPKAAP